MLDNYLKEKQEKKIIVGGDFNTGFFNIELCGQYLIHMIDEYNLADI